jgi:cytochrome d ubiquinol oxidase subunit II
LSAVAALALVAGVAAAWARREGWAFVATGASIVLATFALFVMLFPDVLPSTIAAANSLTVYNASSTPYTLKVMTWVAVAFMPIVLAYQGWTYWVFRKRLTVRQIPVDQSPVVRETA